MRKQLTPMRALVNIIVSIFIAESLGTFLFVFLPPSPTRYIMLFHFSTLIILLSPMLYIVLFRPLSTEISERKQIEHDLRLSKEMGQLVMDNIPQFIFWKDRNSTYMGCNENFARVAGVGKPSAVIGKTDYDLAWRREEADFFQAVDKKVMDTGKAEYHIIEPQLQANGKQAWIDTNKVPLHDEDGKVIGLLGTYEDITERKRAEAALLKRDYQLEVLSRTAVHINAVLELAIIMRTLAESAIELVGSDSGTAGLVIDGKMVFSEYIKEGKVEPVQYSFERGHGIAGWVIETRRPYFTNDAEHDVHVARDFQMTFAIRNLASVPIIGRRGDLLGCLEVHNKAEGLPFEAEDLFMLQGLAASAGVAIENARLISGQR